MLPGKTGKMWGRQFEQMLAHHAAISGLMLRAHGVTLRYLPGGKSIAIKSDLDFKLADRAGNIAFVDAKTVAEPHFTYSFLTPHQLETAKLYESYSLKAGFVVWLRGAQRVVFYSAQVIATKGKGARFGVTDGLDLGPEGFFSLARILAVSDFPGKK